MRWVPYASIVGNLIYAILYTRLDICYVINIVNHYQSNLGVDYSQMHTQVSLENEDLYASLL